METGVEEVDWMDVALDKLEADVDEDPLLRVDEPLELLAVLVELKVPL